MTSTYVPSSDETALMDAYCAKGWTFAFQAGGCHVGGWDDCVVTSPRITFEVNVDLDGWRKPLTEERLLAEESFALADRHDDAIQDAFDSIRDDLRDRLCALYRSGQTVPETVTSSVVVDLSLL